MTDTPDYGEPIRFFDDMDGSLTDRNGYELWEELCYEPEEVSRFRVRAKECVNACAGIRDPEKVVKAWAEVVRLHGLQMDDRTFGYAVRQLVERPEQEANK